MSTNPPHTTDSDVSRNLSMGNVTLNDSINMSLCENSQIDDSFMPGSNSAPLTDITQFILANCLPRVHQDPPPIGKHLTNDADCLTANESKDVRASGGRSMTGELSLSKVEDSIHASAGIAKESLHELFSSRALATDVSCLTINESKDIMVDGQRSLVGEPFMSRVESSIHALASAVKESLPNLFSSRDLADDVSCTTVNESKGNRADGGRHSIVDELSISKVESSIHALAGEAIKDSTMRCSSFVDESLPKFFPGMGQSFGIMELSKTNLGITMYCAPDESKVVNHDLEMPSQVELSVVDPPKCSADIGTSSLGLQNILPPDNMFLEFSIDKLGTTIDATNDDAVFAEEATASKPAETGTVPNVNPNSSQLASNRRQPLSTEPAYGLSDSLAAIERARQAVLDEPYEDFWSDEYEDMMTMHRKDFDLMEFYKEMIRENDNLMDLTTVEFGDAEERDRADESLGEGEPRDGAVELITEDMKNWLAGLKRKVGHD